MPYPVKLLSFNIPSLDVEATCDAEIILSELTTRRDTLNDAVKVVNKRLNLFCRQHHWKLVHHNNISQKEFNRGGLHLNREGNHILYNNIMIVNSLYQ